MAIQELRPTEQMIELSHRPIGRFIFEESQYMSWDWQEAGILNQGTHEIADIWTYQDGFERKGMQSHQIVLSTKFADELTWQYTISDETSRSVINIDLKRNGEMSGWRAEYTEEDGQLNLTAVWELKKQKQIERLWLAMQNILQSQPAQDQREYIYARKQKMQHDLEVLRFRRIGASSFGSNVDPKEKAEIRRALNDAYSSIKYAGFRKSSLVKKPELNPAITSPTQPENPFTEAKEKLLDPLFLKFISIKSLIDGEQTNNSDETTEIDSDPIWQYDRYGNRSNLTAMGQVPLFIGWDTGKYIGWNDPRPKDQSIAELMRKKTADRK